MYKLGHSEDKDRSVAVAVTIRLLDDMTVSVFIRDGRLPNSELNWALSHTGGKLQLWSQLDNILARYVIGEVASISCLSRSKMIASTLEELECTTEKQRHTISFLAEQLKLAFALPKGRRYSLDMLICAFTLCHKSPACYLQILKLLCLDVIERYITTNDGFIAIYYVCEECDETFLRHIMKALKCFTNVLLNNYTKNDTDKLGSMKQSRKVSKLN